MSFEAIRRCYEHASQDIKDGRWAVLLALAYFTNRDGLSWPSVETIAQHAHIKERQTRDTLASLEADGLIAIRRGVGRGSVSVYALLVGLSPAEQGATVEALAAHPTEKVRRAAPFIEAKHAPDRTISFEKGAIGARKGAIEIGVSRVETRKHDPILNRDPQEIHHPPTPHEATPPLAEQPRGGGGSAAPTGPGRRRSAPPPEGARYLVAEGFGDAAVQTWGHLPVEVLRASVERHRANKKQNGGIVNAWRVVPPDEERKPTTTTAPPPVRPAPLDNAPPEMSAEQRRAIVANVRLGRVAS